MPEQPPSQGAMTRRVLLRYAAFQLPGLTMMSLGAAVGHAWFDVPIRVCLTAVGLWILKDMIMFPFVRKAYEPGDGRLPREVNGALGAAHEDLDPTGYVRIGSELWRAECQSDHAPIPKGHPIQVVEVRGLTVTVAKAPESPSSLKSNP